MEDRSKESRFKQVLYTAATQFEPHLSRLEAALGRPLDTSSFAMGMMAAGFAMSGLDIVEAALMLPYSFSEFLAKVEARVERDLGPYRPGVLTSGYYRQEWGQSFEPGTDVQMRMVDERFAEVVLPDGQTRWVERAIVAWIE